MKPFVYFHSQNHITITSSFYCSYFQFCTNSFLTKLIIFVISLKFWHCRWCWCSWLVGPIHKLWVPFYLNNSIASIVPLQSSTFLRIGLFYFSVGLQNALHFLFAQNGLIQWFIEIHNQEKKARLLVISDIWTGTVVWLYLLMIRRRMDFVAYKTLVAT